MNEQERSRVVADEAATERDYSKALEQKTKEAQRLVNANLNNTWTTAPSVESPMNGELVGRVALDSPSEDIDGASEFYVGTAKHETADYQVFNWTASIAACTFYGQPADRENLQVMSELVAGVRVFGHRNGELSDFEDAFLGAETDDLFPKRVLQIPRAPGFASRPPIASTPVDFATQDDITPSSSKSPVEVAPETPDTLHGEDSQPPTGLPPTKMPGPALRAPGLLRRELAAPKKAAMSAVLATLQVDQYEAITKNGTTSQILQGHPGTGKTIIAAHRAAYLLRDEAPDDERIRSHVLILGPTNEYVDHIRTALSGLIDDDRRYEITSIPSLLEQLSELPPSTVPTQTLTYKDVDLGLAKLVDLAYSRSRSNSAIGEKPDRATIYAELVRLLQDLPDGVPEEEWGPYLRTLPGTYDELQRQKAFRHRGLLAYIGIRAERQSRFPGHIIIDEAQDLHPIEWEVLGRLGNSGGWTILGDLNQRRTDHTFSSWDRVATLLAIEDENGQAPVQNLQRGYRSTAQIIHFANQLLPREDRILYSLQQDGERPTVTRIPAAGELIGSAIGAAEDLCARVGEGSVAVITTDALAFSRALQKRGWLLDNADTYVWRKDDRRLRLLPPERARGLEFDGVVVVEPADFPENAGRLGVLYTALTRANRFLTVIYHRALPKGLKAR